MREKYAFTTSMPSFTQTQLDEETARLHSRLRPVGWCREDCALIAPMTLEINQLKQEQDAIILGHSYQTPDIMYGIADVLGDSYGLSLIARDHPAQKIVFCSVAFMGETAKILNPEKEVLIPTQAGCSLAESITPQDVRSLRSDHPEATVIAYVNTSAAVKAASDICCTSANVRQIVSAVPNDEIIFIPDEYMGKNLANETSKRIITWTGRCIVHEEFTPARVQAIREKFPDVVVLTHPECSPAVAAVADFVGGTEGMLRYVQQHQGKTLMLVTECGITDRIRTEFPDRTIVGTCNLCPYMKEIMLRDVLQALQNPTPEQVVTIPQEILEKAQRAMEKMYEMEKMR